MCQGSQKYTKKEKDDSERRRKMISRSNWAAGGLGAEWFRAVDLQLRARRGEHACTHTHTHTRARRGEESMRVHTHTRTHTHTHTLGCVYAPLTLTYTPTLRGQTANTHTL